MTVRNTTDRDRPKVLKLELNRETVRELSEDEAERVQGGLRLKMTRLCTLNCITRRGNCISRHRIRTFCILP